MSEELVAQAFAFGGIVSCTVLGLALPIWGMHHMRDRIRKDWGRYGIDDIAVGAGMIWLLYLIVYAGMSLALFDDKNGFRLEEGDMFWMMAFNAFTLFTPLIFYSFMRGHHHKILGLVSRAIPKRKDQEAELERQIQELKRYGRRLEEEVVTLPEGDSRRVTLHRFIEEAKTRRDYKSEELTDLRHEKYLKELRQIG